MKHIKTIKDGYCAGCSANSLGTTCGEWLSICKTSVTLGTNMVSEKNSNK